MCRNKVLHNYVNRELGGFQLLVLPKWSQETQLPGHSGHGVEETCRQILRPEKTRQSPPFTSHEQQGGLTERDPCPSASPLLSCVSPGTPLLLHPSVRGGQSQAGHESQNEVRGQSITTMSRHLLLLSLPPAPSEAALTEVCMNIKRAFWKV